MCLTESDAGLGSKKHARVTMLPASPSISSLRNSRIHTQSISTLRSNSTSSAEDPLELLRKYKTIFIIDDSSSMEGERWVEVCLMTSPCNNPFTQYNLDADKRSVGFFG